MYIFIYVYIVAHIIHKKHEDISFISISIEEVRNEIVDPMNCQCYHPIYKYETVNEVLCTCSSIQLLYTHMHIINMLVLYIQMKGVEYPSMRCHVNTCHSFTIHIGIYSSVYMYSSYITPRCKSKTHSQVAISKHFCILFRFFFFFFLNIFSYSFFVFTPPLICHRLPFSPPVCGFTLFFIVSWSGAFADRESTS